MAFIFTHLLLKNSFCSSPTWFRFARPVTTRTIMPPTNNLSCFSIFLFRAEHDDWKNDLLFWKTNGWFETMGSFSSKWGSFISFCRSPKGVILNQMAKWQAKKFFTFNSREPFWRLFWSRIGFQHFLVLNFLACISSSLYRQAMCWI